MKKVIIVITFFSLLCGCKHQSSDKGPYNLSILTKLKSSEESSYLSSDNYNESHDIFLTESRRFSLKLRYDIEQSNIVLDTINDHYNFGYTDEEKNQISDFVANYYFITKEKLEVLFPPQYVKASFWKFFYKDRYVIKLYESDSDLQNDNSRDFVYDFINGYLFLVRYDANRILGRDIASSILYFDK